jgi:hypothetical protein
MKKILKLAIASIALPLTAQAQITPMNAAELESVHGQGILLNNLPSYASQLGLATGAVIGANVALGVTSADVTTEANADVLDSKANFNNGVADRLIATGGPILGYNAGYFQLLAQSEQYRATRWRNLITP